MIDCVVLAGRANTGKLKDASMAGLEANIDIAGKTMLSYVIDALENTERIKTIYIVGPENGLSCYRGGKVELVSPGNDMLTNVKAGLEQTGTEMVLVSSSDIPLVTPEIVNGFLDLCQEVKADFYYPVSTKDDCDARFPGIKRTYVTLKDGVFTGGNIFLVRKAVVDKCWPVVEKMIKNRKSPVKMASVFGLSLLMKIAFKIARVEEIEKRVGQVLGIVPRAVVGAPAEISIDVDKPSDLDLCRKVLQK
jgi:GTP:adenosylcobinamide-phosphate guanylyltransferase